MMTDHKLGRITQLTHERGYPPHYFRVTNASVEESTITAAPNGTIRQAILDGAIYGLNADTVINEMAFMIAELMERVKKLENDAKTD